MFCTTLTTRSSHLLFASSLIFSIALQGHAQNSLTGAQPRNSISVLDSTKEQDGLVGSVRRVKTETAKVEIKDGQLLEGPLQILELTTYSIKGNRIENTSYPGPDPLVGKEEYKYDAQGNITEMTLRDERGAIVSRESYSYEFDSVGNWTKMTTSLVLFENGQIKREPIESTYRTITYYFDDNIAKIVDSPVAPAARTDLPTADAPALSPEQLKVKYRLNERAVSAGESAAGQAPPLLLGPPVNAVVTPSVETPANSTSRHDSETNDRVGEQKQGKKGAFSESATRPLETVTSEKPAPTRSAPTTEVAPESVAVKSTAPAEDSPEKVAFNLYQKGRAFFESGDVQGAIGAFMMSVNYEPSAEVYLNLGYAYLKIDKNSDASKAFKQSTKLNANVAEAQYGFGLASFRLKRFVDAREAFKKATLLEPRMAKAHYALGLTYIELGQPDASVVEVRVLEQLDKSLAKQLTGTFPRMKDPCRTSLLCQ